MDLLLQEQINFNGYIKGNADVLNANGNAAFEFEDDGQFAIGLMQGRHWLRQG